VRRVLAAHGTPGNVRRSVNDLALRGRGDVAPSLQGQGPVGGRLQRLRRRDLDRCLRRPGLATTERGDGRYRLAARQQRVHRSSRPSPRRPCPRPSRRESSGGTLLDRHITATPGQRLRVTERRSGVIGAWLVCFTPPSTPPSLQQRLSWGCRTIGRALVGRR